MRTVFFGYELMHNSGSPDMILLSKLDVFVHFE